MPDTSAPATLSPEQDPRIYFAAERTLLAWVRTGLALMGLGFAIARFGLFLRQIQLSAPTPQPTSSAGSSFTGIFLIALGVLVNVVGITSYTRNIRQLSTGRWIPGRISRPAVTLGVILAILGIILAARLFAIA